jgi:hypothetical protein
MANLFREILHFLRGKPGTLAIMGGMAYNKQAAKHTES